MTPPTCLSLHPSFAVLYPDESSHSPPTLVRSVTPAVSVLVTNSNKLTPLPFVHSIPTPEGLAPSSVHTLDSHLTKLIHTYTLAGTPILVHCRGGVGRAGLVACCWALKLGLCGWVEMDAVEVKEKVKASAIVDGAIAEASSNVGAPRLIGSRANGPLVTLDDGGGGIVHTSRGGLVAKDGLSDTGTDQERREVVGVEIKDQGPRLVGDLGEIVDTCAVATVGPDRQGNEEAEGARLNAGHQHQPEGRINVRSDTMQLIQRVIGLLRRRRSAKAVETFEQVKFLVEYVEFLRAKEGSGQSSMGSEKLGELKVGSVLESDIRVA